MPCRHWNSYLPGVVVAARQVVDGGQRFQRCAWRTGVHGLGAASSFLAQAMYEISVCTLRV